MEGCRDDCEEGCTLGWSVGCTESTADGREDHWDGLAEGCLDGWALGYMEGCADGTFHGLCEAPKAVPKVAATAGHPADPWAA